MPHSGDINGKYTAIRVAARNCGPDDWHVGQYLGLRAWLAGRKWPRLGKVISINGSGDYRTVMIEHPFETLPPQPFPEYEVNTRPAPHGGRFAR